MSINKDNYKILKEGKENSCSDDLKLSLEPAIYKSSSVNSKLKHEYTLDEAFNMLGNGPFQMKLLWFTGMIWAADAMEMMVLAYIVPKFKKQFNLHSPYDALIPILVFAGMLCGTETWSILSDKIGRKKVIMMGNLCGAIFGVLSGFSPNIWFLYVFQFGIGFAVGCSAVEYAPQESRGSQLFLEQSFWGFGELVACGIGWSTLQPLGWRYCLIFISIPLWLISIFSFTADESVRYLYATQQYDKCKVILKKMSLKNKRSLPSGTLKIPSKNDNEYLKEKKTSHNGNIFDLFAPSYRKTSVVVLLLFFLTVVQYYGIVFVSDRYFSKVSSKKLNKWMSLTITTASELPGYYIGYLIIDKYGRKKIMSIAFIIFGSSSAVSIFSYIIDNIYLSIISVFISRLNIAANFVILYIYISEYYPTIIRTTALGTASAVGRIGGIFTSYISEDLSVVMALSVYTICGIVCIILVYLLPIETLGKELSDNIDEE